MPIRDPGKYRDKTADWSEFFYRVRQQELTPLVTDALIAEHRDDPRGISKRHSYALQDVLNHMHGVPIDGKTFVFAVVPYQEYRIGILHSRGVEPTILQERAFSTEDEAVHAVFLQRLESLGIWRVRGNGAAP
jgi:hypothetical protein